MKINLSHILITLVIIIGLVAGNVYQYQNPTVVEISLGQTAIDSTTWVKRTAFATRGLIIDSLRSQNETLADRIRRSKDRIASYTSIIGQLRLKVDSLERGPVRLDSIFAGTPDLNVMDTTVTFRKTFSGGLFQVTSDIIFDWPYLDNRLQLTQQRPIRIDMASTLGRDPSRMLIYVTSPDFADLKYQSYTELKLQKKFPKFWLGAGMGVAATLTGIIVLQ